MQQLSAFSQQPLLIGVGAAWAHKDGKGYTLQLETCPINGRIVLRTPLEDTPETGRGA